MQKAERWQLAQQDLRLLKYMASHSVKQAALEFNRDRKEKWSDPEGAIRAWLHRIRVRIGRYQYYLNNIYALQKRSPRVRKLTISGAVEHDEED